MTRLLVIIIALASLLSACAVTTIKPKHIPTVTVIHIEF
jgi:hypothetical protein